MSSELFPILVQNICEKTCVATSQEKEMLLSIIKNNIIQKINKIYVTRYHTFFILLLPIVDVCFKHSWMIFRIVIINEGKDSKLRFRFVSQEKHIRSFHYSGKEFKFEVPANTTIYRDVKIRKFKKEKGKIFIGIGDAKNYKKIVLDYKKIEKPITLKELKRSHFLGLTEKLYVDQSAILSIIYALKESKRSLVLKKILKNLFFSLVFPPFLPFGCIGFFSNEDIKKFHFTEVTLGNLGISQETILAPPEDIMTEIYEQRKQAMVAIQNELQRLMKTTDIEHTMDDFKHFLTLRRIAMDHLYLNFFLYPNIYPMNFINDFQLHGYVTNASYDDTKKISIKISSSNLARSSISTTMKILPNQVIPFSFPIGKVFGKRKDISLNVNYKVIVKIKKLQLNLFQSILSWFKSTLLWFTDFFSWVFFHLFLFLLFGTCYCFLSDLGCVDSMKNRFGLRPRPIRRVTGDKYRISLPIEISDSVLCPHCKEFTSDFDQEKQIWFCTKCNSYVSPDIKTVEQSIKDL